MQFGAMMKFFKGLTHEGRMAQCREKIENLFQVNNRVINRRSGAVFTVCEVGTGQAMLLDEKGDPLVTSWFTSAGRLKHEMADVWDMAQA